MEFAIRLNNCAIAMREFDQKIHALSVYDELEHGNTKTGRKQLPKE